MQKVEITLAFPPSVNHIWLRSKTGGVFLSREAKLFRADTASRVCLARSQGILPRTPIEGNINLLVALRPPDRRVRDLDNYNKALWDALTHARVWIDDQQVKDAQQSWLEYTGRKEACAQLTLIWE